MYPNEPTPPPAQPQSVDYLNQIAPQVPKKPRLSFGPKMIVLIGGGLVLVVLILVVSVNLVGGAQKQPIEHLAARYTVTQAIAKAAQPNIKSSELRALNSNLTLYFTNIQRDIAAPLLSTGVNTAKLSDGVVKQESGAAVTARLENARLNAVYDRTYAREMAYKLGTILTLLKQIYARYGTTIESAKQTTAPCTTGTTCPVTLKTFIGNAYVNLAPTQKAFDSFDAASN